MISVDEAQAAVLGRASFLPPETVPLARSLSRVLREPVIADRDQPPFNRSAMDGFAIRAADAAEPGARLEVVGEVRAGSWPDRELGAGEALRIMTGAPVPRGADAVIQVERTRMSEATDGGFAQVLLEVSVQAGRNVVARGSEAVEGAVLLREGVRIGVPHLAVLASAGVAEPVVSRKPRVAVIVTGDEVIDVGGRPSAAQIRNANGPALLAAIHEAGGLPTDLGIVPDDPSLTRDVIERAVREGHDAVVISGGVSAGDFDFVEGALSQLGVVLHVSAVRVKPGAPFVFGTRGSTLFFGLPGNPVSAQVTFELFARPALLKMQGALVCLRPSFEATLEGPLTNRSARRCYLPVNVVQGAGGLTAKPIPTQGSGDVAAHARANALAVLEPDRKDAAAGERVALHPLTPFIEA